MILREMAVSLWIFKSEVLTVFGFCFSCGFAFSFGFSLVWLICF